ncbi:MAG: hypothetical protein EBW11_05530 [Betaproteobacteria bacterium]|nr:hypothetical protein [Betaproteobacteria bacterium]
MLPENRLTQIIQSSNNEIVRFFDIRRVILSRQVTALSCPRAKDSYLSLLKEQHLFRLVGSRDKSVTIKPAGYKANAAIV